MRAPILTLPARSLSALAVPALALPVIAALGGPALACRSAREPICHATRHGYVLLNARARSAHFDPSRHPRDVPPGVWYVDADGDGFGDAERPVYGCPAPGLVDNGDDCDDTDGTLAEDCGGTPRLFALIEGDVVGIDPETAEAGLWFRPEIEGEARHLTWDPTAGRLYTLADRSHPRLVTLDPCTGAVESEVALSHRGAPVYFCEGMSYDRHRARLVGACSLDGSLEGGDTASESVVAIDVGTGAVTLLASRPQTFQREFDDLFFVGPDARATDGAGTVPSNHWYAVDGDTWGTRLLTVGAGHGFPAWDFADGLFYALVGPDGAGGANPGAPFELQIQDEDSRAVEVRVGSTGLEAQYVSGAVGMTFADFTCP